MPRAVIAGASLLGLMVALRLRDHGWHVDVLDREDVRDAPTGVLPAPPLPLEPGQADAFGRWTDRSGVYPRPLEADAAAILDLDAWWSAAVADAHAAGVAIRSGHRVVGVAVAGGAVAGVRTDQGTLAADVMVVAAGAAAVGITPALGVQLPVVPESVGWCAVPSGAARAAVRRVATPADRGSVHAAVAVDEARGRTWYGAYRSFGSAGPRREALARDYLHTLIGADSDAGDASDGPLVWRRHAHCTADHAAVVGAVPNLAHLVLALPHGPFGNARAPSLAEAAVRAATGAAPLPGDASWSPARFPQGATGGRMKAVA